MPRLPSDSGPYYIVEELAGYLQENGKENGITRTRGPTYHPQTKCQIEQ
jgi:hypothetical protein